MKVFNETNSGLFVEHSLHMRKVRG